jgi:polyhydroxybutyrate depolymerase
MNLKIIFSLIIALLILSACKKDHDKHDNKFKFDGTNRYYRYYKPENLPSNAPLIFVLHGYTQTNDAFYDLGFNQIADTAKFFVCYPQGKNFAWEVYSHNSTDVGFLKALAQYLQKEYSLNPNKTYVTGFSMGGAMCNLLAFDAMDVFKAVAPVAGFISANVWSSKNPQNAIPYFVIHGTSDPIVSINGYANGDPSIQSIADYWTSQNNCTTTDTVQFNTNTTAYYNRNGTNGNEVWYYKIDGQGHAWPGSGWSGDVSGFNACDVIWNFFRKY